MKIGYNLVSWVVNVFELTLFNFYEGLNFKTIGVKVNFTKKNWFKILYKQKYLTYFRIFYANYLLISVNNNIL